MHLGGAQDTEAFGLALQAPQAKIQRPELQVQADAGGCGAGRGKLSQMAGEDRGELLFHMAPGGYKPVGPGGHVEGKRFDLGGLEAVLAEEAEKCRLLSDLGINVNLGPVCDITTDPEAFMYTRSLGQDAQTTAEVTAGIVNLMRDFRVGSVLKHFPGYGNNADTHTGIAVDSRPLSDFESQDFLPFSAGIQAGCGGILVGHILVEALDPELPASLSPAVHRYLREELGFSGVIMTDDLVMQAITDQYGAGEAAVMAVLSGNDLLCSTEYAVQYEAVLQAVLDGRIDIDVLNSAVRNVLEWKISLGLL